MFRLSFTLLALLFATSTLASPPRCVLFNGRLFGKDLDSPCVHYTSDYSDGRAVDSEGGVEIVLSDPSAKPALELYSGELMNLPNDKCCPPETFTQEIGCSSYVPQGECCVTGDSVHVWGLSSDIGCVHSVETYASYVPSSGNASWSTSNPGSNHEVELYLALHSNGCCGCFLHSLPCGSC